MCTMFESKITIENLLFCNSYQTALEIFNATIAEGIPQKLEHNDIMWITPAEIPNYDFCPADVEILKKITEVYQ